MRDGVLAIASMLKDPSTPGIIVLVLLIACFAAILILASAMRARARILHRLTAKVEAQEERSFALHGFEDVSAWVHDGLKGPRSIVEPLQEAWEEFGETLFVDDRDGQPVRRNTVRPSVFFNVEDLGYGPGFYRILPGIFVSVGLALTFLGLIGALREMSEAGEISDVTMLSLIGIASAKFIMSLSGLLCSIFLTLALRFFGGGVEKELHRLVRRLERRFDFVSLETLALEQLKVQRDAQDANRKLGFELVAELGKPLRDELPEKISAAINQNMAPILEQISRQGTESVSSMATDLSKQVTDGMGEALASAGAAMERAAGRIEQLADRMDNSSGRMGSEMEASVVRMAQAVDELRGAMAAVAKDTGGAFTAGAEQLLEAMNRTLEGIRANTGESARAMSDAAAEMTRASRTMKDEMEDAARAGSEAASRRMEVASAEVGDAISGAGASLAGRYEEAAGRIAELAQNVSSQAGRELLAPLQAIEGQLKGVVGTLDEGLRGMRGLADAAADGARAGSEAAGTFRAASQAMVEAAGPIRSTVERLETSTRQLNDNAARASETVIRSSNEVAASADRTLRAAGDALGAEQRSIATVVGSIEELVRAMKGQGERLDQMDQKLGHAFEVYADSTEKSMQSIRSHLQEMAGEMNVALDAMKSIVDALQDFEPQQRKAG